MKRVLLILGLVGLLALAACNGTGPTVQEAETVTAPGVGEATASVPEEGAAEVGAAATTEAPSTELAGLTGVTWEWVSVLDPAGQTAAADPARYTLTFNQDGSVTILADCNNVSGGYFTDGSSLNIQLAATTLTTCAPESQYQLFLNSLPRAGNFVIEGGELFIDMIADGGTLIFQAAGSAPGSGTTVTPTTLTGVNWQWVSTSTTSETIGAADPARYTITFNEDGTAGIQADCNGAGATYATDESGALSITAGAATLMACPADSQDTQFMQGLSNVVAYSLTEEGLVLALGGDGGEMHFRAEGQVVPAEEPALTGTTWQWLATATPVEATAVNEPARYTVLFNADGTAAITADCNAVGATYTATETDLAIQIGPGTMMGCPGDSQADTFLSDLAAAATYRIEGGNLIIGLAEDGGSMQFAPAETTVISEPPSDEPGAPPPAPPPAPAGLTGVVWRWEQIATAGGTTTVNDPSRYTIQFNADGTAALRLDCNSAAATYVVSAGNTLTITPGPTSAVACGGGSLDQTFLGGLTNSFGYRLEGGKLIIDMLYQSGSLVFSPAP